jgi:hypothetical protein
MMRVVIPLIALGGCAAPACRPVVEHVVTPSVEHIVALPDTRGPDALIAEYASIRRDERAYILRAGPGHLRSLIPLDKAAHSAMAPIAASNHVATPAEMQRAIAALGQLRAYLSTPKVK